MADLTLLYSGAPAIPLSLYLWLPWIVLGGTAAPAIYMLGSGRD